MTVRARQVAGVTALVAVAVVGVSLVHVVSVMRLRLADAVGRAELLANALFQAATKVVPGAPDPYAALRADTGVRALLESSVAYAGDVTDAAIVDPAGVAIVHCYPALEGRTQPPREPLAPLLQRSAWAQWRAVASGRVFELRQPLWLDRREFGAIRIGVSMLLIAESLRATVGRVLWLAAVSLVVATLAAGTLAGWMLRPIHVISSGLARLGRGEFDVPLDLPPGDEFRALGASFRQLGAQLAAARRAEGGGSPAAEARAGASRAGPGAAPDRPARGYSQKLAAFGRVLAGVAHEVKNPLNAMTIHLELLRQKLDEAGAASPAVARHLTVIGDEIKRLDQVMAGLMKVVRPEELHLQPVQAGPLIAEVVRVIEPEAKRAGVAIRVDGARELPDINADPGMLQQALVNLALNACQAMPEGGTLELRCRTAPGRRVEIAVSDTGVGIPPEHLDRIFDLYFTTKPTGSGIGLSLVYRIVQLHEGEISVESTPGRGTTFRLLLPQT